MATSHPWNDLEQRFLNFTTTIRQLAEAISIAVDDGRVPAQVIDTVFNLSTGLVAYTTTCEDEIATAMEQKICHDYKTEAFQQTTGTLTIGDDYTVQLPKYVVGLLGWGPEDTLVWQIGDEGKIIVRKLEK